MRSNEAGVIGTVGVGDFGVMNTESANTATLIEMRYRCQIPKTRLRVRVRGYAGLVFDPR